jgi:tRNA-dihydrouridine synthase 1
MVDCQVAEVPWWLLINKAPADSGSRQNGKSPCESYLDHRQTLPRMIEIQDLRYIAAPMVKQSDLPFRTLTRKYGATTAYTQMLLPDRLLNDQEYLEHHIRDLTLDPEFGHPVVVQLCGNDVQTIVDAGRKLQNYCDGIGKHNNPSHQTQTLKKSESKIDLNLGCPQEAARDGHFGAYLLGQKDWPLVESIGVSVRK